MRLRACTDTGASRQPESECEEVDLDVVLIGLQAQWGHLRLSERGHRLSDPGDAQPADPDGWRPGAFFAAGISRDSPAVVQNHSAPLRSCVAPVNSPPAKPSAVE